MANRIWFGVGVLVAACSVANSPSDPAAPGPHGTGGAGNTTHSGGSNGGGGNNTAGSGVGGSGDCTGLSDGQICLPANGACDADDVCEGGVCVHSFAAAGGPCGDPNQTECNGADACDGVGTCLANIRPQGSPCGDQGVNCLTNDRCDGSGQCTDGGVAADGAACDLGVGQPNNDYCLNGTCHQAAECADGSAEDSFALGAMVGCSGAVAFANGGSVCGAGSHVCSANEWMTRFAGQLPTFNYWTSEVLNWAGNGPDDCAAGPNLSGNTCPTEPMRVCAGPSDPLGNVCNWYNCGFNTPAPNFFFGGCEGNSTAGTLCCAP